MHRAWHVSKSKHPTGGRCAVPMHRSSAVHSKSKAELACIMISQSFSSLPGSLLTLQEVWNLRCSTPAISSADSAKLSTWLTAAARREQSAKN